MLKKSSTWFVLAFISVILFFATPFLNAVIKTALIDSTVLAYALKVLGIVSILGILVGVGMGVKYSEK